MEPERRDSTAAVGAAAAWTAAGDPKTLVAALATDHVFKDGAKFVRLCAQAGVAAEAGEIVTFGVTPDYPTTAYGYIHPAEPLAVDPQVRRVERFLEKPNEERALAFIKESYQWTSGNFVFSADAMLEELARFEPEIAAATSAAVAFARTDLGFVVLDKGFFVKALKRSIDYAVMERTRRAAVPAADVSCGRRTMVDRLADEPAGRTGQRPPRPGGGDQLLKRSGALGGASGPGHRPRQRDRGRNPAAQCWSPTTHRATKSKSSLSG